MPLQNRVDPFGEIHAVEWRGMFTGNRGVIHDPDTQDPAQAALDDQGLDHLRLRLQGQAAASDGPQRAERQRRLDRAVLPRRGDGAGRRPPALLLLPARSRPRNSCAATARRSAWPSRRSARSTSGCMGSGWLRADITSADVDHRMSGSASAAGRRHGLPGRSAASPSTARRCAPGHFCGLWRRASTISTWRCTMIWLITPPTTLAVLKAGYQPVWHPTIGAKARRPLA